MVFSCRIGFRAPCSFFRSYPFATIATQYLATVESAFGSHISLISL